MEDDLIFTLSDGTPVRISAAVLLTVDQDKFRDALRRNWDGMYRAKRRTLNGSQAT